MKVSSKRIRRVELAMRRVTQRVNLFEKILKPEAKANIRKIMLHLGDAERAAVVARLAALEDMSRGTVVDEPASTKRAGLDQARRDRELALLPKPKVDRPKPVAPPAPKEKIAKKWYFWVTLLAIAASGAAITAFAVKAAKDDRPDDLDASAGRVRLMGPPDQGFGLRF